MKKILLILFVATVLCLFFLLVANFIYFKNSSTIQRAEINGRDGSEFIAETVANSSYIEFVFTPKAEKAEDYLISYVLREDKNIIDEANKKLKESVSKSDPIILDLERKKESEYSLEMKISSIYDSQNYLHDDKIVIHPLEIK